MKENISKLKNIFCIGIAKRTTIRKHIDMIYEKNKTTYLMKYKNSDIYKTKLTQSTDYLTESYTEKVIGILEDSLEKKDLHIIIELYKKVYRRFYMNIKDIKNISYNLLLNNLSVGVEGNYEFISAIYVFKILTNKFTFIELEDELIELLIDRTINDMNMVSVYIDINYSDKIISEFKDEINELRKKLGIQKHMYTLESLITDVLDRDITQYNNKITTQDMVDIEKIQKIGDIGKYVGSVEGFFKFLQLDTNIVATKTILTQKEINQILLSYVFSEKFNHFTEKDTNQFIIFTLYLYVFNKEYKKLKEDYIININEEHLLEIESINKKIIKTKQECNEIKKLSNDREKVLLAKEQTYISENKILEKENINLKQKLNEYIELKEEVVKLRNIVFNNSVHEEPKEDWNISTELQQTVEELNKKSVIVIGGHINWIKKMRKSLPNWTYISMDNLNNDLQMLKNYEFIFINTKMKHSLYFKVRDILKKYSLTYDYIVPFNNIKIIIEDIYNKILN